MAQASIITLNGEINAIAYPVAFSPRSASPSSTRLVAYDEGSTNRANPWIELKFLASTSRRKSTHVIARLGVPIERFIGDPTFGNKEVVGEFLFDGGKQIIPDIATEDERLHFTALVASLMGNGLFLKYARYYDPMY